jgi:hypothetical protein
MALPVCVEAVIRVMVLTIQHNRPADKIPEFKRVVLSPDDESPDDGLKASVLPTVGNYIKPIFLCGNHVT